MLDETTISLGSVTFSKVHIDKDLPVPVPGSRVKQHFMTMGAGGSGIRVLEGLGAHISYSDFNFTAELVTNAQMATLMGYFLDQSTPRTLLINVPGSSVISYTVMFAENGLIPSMQDPLSEYYDRFPFKATFNLHVMKRNS